jgi:hypothetical protein
MDFGARCVGFYVFLMYCEASSSLPANASMVLDDTNKPLYSRARSSKSVCLWTALCSMEQKAVPHVQRSCSRGGKQLARRHEEGRKKALRLSTLNSVETYRKPRRSVSLAKMTWILVQDA